MKAHVELTKYGEEELLRKLRELGVKSSYIPLLTVKTLFELMTNNEKSVVKVELKHKKGEF